MNFYEYTGMEEIEQYEELWFNGVQVAQREEPEFDIDLYQIHNFYIELFYDKADKKLHRLRPFCNTNSLDSYLCNFNIDALCDVLWS